MAINSLFAETHKVVNAISPVDPPSTAAGDIVSLKNYGKCTIIITTDNDGAGVTGSAITLRQSTLVDGTGDKELAFTTMRQNIDTAATDTLTVAAVTSNTFTTVTTASKLQMYVIEINDSDLDVANSFDCLQVLAATGVAMQLSAIYVLSEPRFGGVTPPTAITD